MCTVTLHLCTYLYSFTGMSWICVYSRFLFFSWRQQIFLTHCLTQNRTAVALCVQGNRGNMYEVRRGLVAHWARGRSTSHLWSVATVTLAAAGQQLIGGTTFLGLVNMGESRPKGTTCSWINLSLKDYREDSSCTQVIPSHVRFTDKFAKRVCEQLHSG